MATKPMTKTQLVAALAEDMGTDKKSASAALDAITGLITKEVGEQIKKEADKVVKMTIAKALKDSVNG